MSGKGLIGISCQIHLWVTDDPLLDQNLNYSGSEGKETAHSAGDAGSIPGLGRSTGEGNGYALQSSCLENPWTEKPGGLQSMQLQSQK